MAPFYYILFLLITHRNIPPAAGTAGTAGGGQWKLLQKNIGISAMHMQLLHNDRVVIFDRTDIGASNISLPDGVCRHNPNDTVSPVDCTAHSVEYDAVLETVRPLMIQTDTWCSSGAVTSNGTLIQTGGYNDGERAVRFFDPCDDRSCDWKEKNLILVRRRWYATNQILPDGRLIIVGGRRQFNYEFFPKNSQIESNLYSLRFLVETNDFKIENNLYPFVFLNSDGNLFIFANNRAILFDYSKNSVIKTYPEIPGGDPRSYPSSGSAVLLPIKNNTAGEVLVCGGAPKGSYISANNGKFLPALNTCARIRIHDPKPEWIVQTMPMPRVMSDMVLLPTGDVLIINGGSSGTAGWGLGRDPVLSPVLYRPLVSSFKILAPSTIPRMYHSTAVLLRDGRILVGGSNPQALYKFVGVLFPTDLSLEAFSPPYLRSKFRPRLISPNSSFEIGYNLGFSVRFGIDGVLTLDKKLLTVTMVLPSFSTHSFSMNQRMVVVDIGRLTAAAGRGVFEVEAVSPESNKVAPAGYYLVFVVYNGVPSEGVWVRIM